MKVLDLLQQEKDGLVKKMNTIIERKEELVNEFCSNHNDQNEVVDLYEKELKLSLEIRKLEKAMKEIVRTFIVEQKGEIITYVVFKELFLVKFEKNLIFISEKSPMGEALVNSTESEVVYNCPKGERKLKILKSY